MKMKMFSNYTQKKKNHPEILLSQEQEDKAQEKQGPLLERCRDELISLAHKLYKRTALYFPGTHNLGNVCKFTGGSFRGGGASKIRRIN